MAVAMRTPGLAALVLTLVACLASPGSMQADINVISSGYGQQLWTFGYDADSANASVTDTQDCDPNMTFLVVDKERDGTVYATHEVDSYGDIQNSGVVSRWTNVDGTYQRQEYLSSEGSGPAHVALDKANGLLYVANYGGATFTAFALASNGSISHSVYNEFFPSGSGVDPDRQNDSHPHGAYHLGKFVYVVDLGADKIHHYEVTNDDGEVGLKKANPAETACEPGSGPRHMAIDQANSRAYVLNELQMSVAVYSIDTTTGAMTHVDTVPYVMEQPNPNGQYGAEIAIHPNGVHLYISTRGTGAIIVFEISETSITQLSEVKLDGTWPRHFVITDDGAHLIVASQMENNMEIFEVDQTTGLLEKKADVGTQDQPAVVAVI